jgi:hypothetical protein
VSVTSALVNLDTRRLLAHDLPCFRRRGRNGDNFGLALARSRPCEPALGSLDKALTESTLRARAETGIVGIGDPLSKPRMWNEKLSKAYNEICSV